MGPCLSGSLLTAIGNGPRQAPRVTIETGAAARATHGEHRRNTMPSAADTSRMLLFQFDFSRDPTGREAAPTLTRRERGHRDHLPVVFGPHARVPVAPLRHVPLLR